MNLGWMVAWCQHPTGNSPVVHRAESEREMTEDGKKRTPKIIRLLRVALPYAFVAVLVVSAFTAGKYYQPALDRYNEASELTDDVEQAREKYLKLKKKWKERRRKQQKEESPDARSKGCNHYNEPFCRAPEKVIGDIRDCFALKGSKVPESGHLNVPFECRNVGPFGIFDIEDLRGDYTFEIKPITEVPAAIRPYFGEVTEEFSTESALAAFMLILQAGGHISEQEKAHPDYVSIMQKLNSTSDGTLSDDDKVAIAQMLRIYSRFASAITRVRMQMQKEVAKECAGFKDNGADVVPMRCIIVADSTTQ